MIVYTGNFRDLAVSPLCMVMSLWMQCELSEPEKSQKVVLKTPNFVRIICDLSLVLKSETNFFRGKS